MSIEGSTPTTSGLGAISGSAVRIVDWQSDWPDQFERERASLAAAFDGVPVEIEHVGSTSVQGLAAKPIIDICIGVEHLDVIEERIGVIEALGYTYVPQYEDELPDRRYFRRPAEHPRTHHVHCFVLGGAEWLRHIGFRDRLRSSPELVNAYARLKRKLAEECGDDRHRYTDSKSAFIEDVLSQPPPAAAP